jgi:hypothetical protein
MLFIPANNSSTGMFQLPSDNDGKGMILKPKVTRYLALKSDYGIMMAFRKAFITKLFHTIEEQTKNLLR